MTIVRRFPDLKALARAAADEFGQLARAGARHFALSGGSTPKTMFEELALRGRQDLPWDKVELWWGDERCVPPDHPDSNFGMTKRALLDPLRIDPARVHRIEGEREPEAAARDYERALIAALGAPPKFDLVLLGMGPDGHTASLFHGSPALSERDRWVVANPVDSPLTKGKTTRITLTAPAIDSASKIRFLVAGADKAERLREVLEGPRGVYPAQMIHGRDVVWLVDEAAAARLS